MGLVLILYRFFAVLKQQKFLQILTFNDFVLGGIIELKTVFADSWYYKELGIQLLSDSFNEPCTDNMEEFPLIPLFSDS